MSSIKKLVSQTAWSGLSSIAARFISYLLVPYLTWKFTESAYGEMSIVYSFIPFLNVIVTHGMETAYFRFGTKENEEKLHEHLNQAGYHVYKYSNSDTLATKFKLSLS